MGKLIYISILLAIFSQSSYGSRDNLDYELNILGDNNYERIDTDTTDPGVTVFKPINNAEIRNVKCGDENLWKRSGKKHLFLVRVFKVGLEYSFMNLYYRDGKKIMAEIFVRNGETWKKTGKYQVKNPEEIMDEPLPESKSLTNSDSIDTSGESTEEKSDEEKEETVDLDLEGDMEDIAKVREYNAVGVPTVELRPFWDKAIGRVTHKFQTIWKREDSKKPIKEVFYYRKEGYVPLLHIATGAELFDPGDSFYEQVKDQWVQVKPEQFLLRLKYAMMSEVDPQFDQPLDIYGGELPSGMDKEGNNRKRSNTWPEYKFRAPVSNLKGYESLNSPVGSFKSAVEDFSGPKSISSIPESGPYMTATSESPIEERKFSDRPILTSGTSVSSSSGSFPEENEYISDSSFY